MRTAITVFAIILAVIFIGGGIDVGSQPIFGYIDAILGTSFFMKVHYSVFWPIYRGEDTVEEGFGKTESGLKEFSERPVGIDNKRKYRDLDKASDH